MELPLGDVGHPAAPGRVRPTREPQPGDDGAEEIARAVAFGAMAGAVDEIRAAIPTGFHRLIRLERLAPLEEQQFPDSQPAAIP